MKLTKTLVNETVKQVLKENYSDDLLRITEVLTDHHLKVLDNIKEHRSMRYESNIEDRYLSYLDPGYRRLSDIRDVLGDMEGWLYLPEDDYKELIVILAETEDPNRLLDGINKLFTEFEKDTLDLIKSFKPED